MSVFVSAAAKSRERSRESGTCFRLVCPRERAPLTIESDHARCVVCGTIYRRENNIWRMVTPAQFARHENFLDHYRVVRRAEGWGSRDAAYYRNLPNVAPDDPQREIWRVRASSFKSLLRVMNKPARVLDLGAGNGWLANQLALRGHHVSALDLSDDEFDGLGAVKNYATTFECYQADFETLPFADAQFDGVIFNAALHYVRDLEWTTREALRVLDANGRLVVMDSPLYRKAESGEKMLAERERFFRERFGFDDADETIGFLTFADFEKLAHTFSLRWRWVESFVGVRWAMRSFVARIKQLREPARFGLMIGTRR